MVHPAVELAQKAIVERASRKRQGTTSGTEPKMKRSKENSASANIEDPPRPITL